MKILAILITFITLMSCKNTEYATFGKEITPENAIEAKDLFQKYSTLKNTDTLEVKVKAKIGDVCQKKGCWITLELSENKEAFVKFKDYGFFIPLNASGNTAILNGKAFIETQTVDELKHYAKDEGKSQSEIDAIIAPEITYSFVADGVLLEKNN